MLFYQKKLTHIQRIQKYRPFYYYRKSYNRKYQFEEYRRSHSIKRSAEGKNRTIGISIEGRGREK